MDGLTPEQEWAKALSHSRLFNEIILNWSWDWFNEDGSYNDCAPWKRDEILEWLRRKPHYKQCLEEVDAAEAQRVAEAQAAAVGGDDGSETTLGPEIVNLEERITNLEATFAYIKEMRARKGKDGASSSKAGSSRKKINGLFRLICLVWLSSCLV